MGDTGCVLELYLTELFGIAMAIALSPLAIMPAILMLSTARPKVTGWTFLGGWLAGLLALTGAFSLLAGIIEFYQGTPIWASWLRLLLGVALVAFGVKKWLSRKNAAGSPEWMAQIASYDGGQALKTGLLLTAANPKVLVFCAAAGMAIGSSELGLGAGVWLSVAFALTAAATVILPVVAYAVSGEAMAGPLERLKRWLERNNAALMAALFLVLGVLLAVKGIDGLR